MINMQQKFYQKKKTKVKLKHKFWYISISNFNLEFGLFT